MTLFNLNLRPFMDEESGVGGGSPAPSSAETVNNEPSNNEPSGEPNSGVADQGQGADPASQKAVQTPEQNAAFAQMRREADQARRDAEQAKRDISIAKKYGADYGVYSEADIVAKYGQSHGVKTAADFEAALQKQEQDKEYKAAGIDPDAMNKLIENHPAIQAAKAQQGQAAINAEISELASEYPDLKIKTLADMQALPNFEAIKAKAYKGMTLLEAYEAVNRAEIRQRAKEEGAQGAIRNIGSKAHLGTEKSGNTQQGKEVEISPEKMRAYRGMGYSEAEARKREAKYLKKK